MDLINAYNEIFEYIAFVDIDGVLNNQYFKGEYVFTKESVEVINYLYEKYNIKLVLSSSWRQAYSFTFIQSVFKENGIKAPLIDKTNSYISNSRFTKPMTIEEILDKDDDEIFSREYEIYEWIKIFKPKHYVIFDDFKMKNKELFNHQILTQNWGNNESLLGLRKFHIDRIDKILKLKED